MVEVNTALEANPEWVNEDPYGKAWLIKVGRAIRPNSATLMDAKTYESTWPKKKRRANTECMRGDAMTYIPNTDADRAEMLKVVGVESVADLFHDVPAEQRFPELVLPPALSEMEILQELGGLADENDDLQHVSCFLGAGAYNHFVPGSGGLPVAALRVLHRLHAVPAGDQPGHTAGAFRVPDHDRRADRHGSGQRLALRRGHCRGRGRDHGACRWPGASATASCSAPRCTRSTAKWCAPTRRAWA